MVEGGPYRTAHWNGFLAVSVFVYLDNLMSALEDLERTEVVGWHRRPCVGDA